MLAKAAQERWKWISRIIDKKGSILTDYMVLIWASEGFCAQNLAWRGRGSKPFGGFQGYNLTYLIDCSDNGLVLCTHAFDYLPCDQKTRHKEEHMNFCLYDVDHTCCLRDLLTFFTCFMQELPTHANDPSPYLSEPSRHRDNRERRQILCSFKTL